MNGTEPVKPLGRHIFMRAATLSRTALQVGLGAVLAGCAAAGPQAQPQETALAESECTASMLAEAPARDLVALDRGTGEPSQVQWVAPDQGPCGGRLLARLDDQLVGLDVSDLDLAPESAVSIRLRDVPDGHPRDLLLMHGAVHPRGGYQPHVFVLDRDVQELLVDGRPLLPFVATDGGAAPMAVRCGDGGSIEQLTALPGDPQAGAPTWNVERTTYRWDGDGVAVSGPVQAESAVTDEELRRSWPDLLEAEALFSDCRA